MLNRLTTWWLNRRRRGELEQARRDKAAYWVSLASAAGKERESAS